LSDSLIHRITLISQNILRKGEYNPCNL